MFPIISHDCDLEKLFPGDWLIADTFMGWYGKCFVFWYLPQLHFLNLTFFYVTLVLFHTILNGHTFLGFCVCLFSRQNGKNNSFDEPSVMI